MRVTNLGLNRLSAREPLHDILQILRRPVQPDEQEAVDGDANRPRGRNPQHTGGLPKSNKLFKMNPHRSEITGYQHTPLIRRDSEHVRVGGAVGNNAGRRLEFDRWFPADQPPPDVGVDIGVSLKSDLQASLAAASLRARSNRSIMSCGIGYRALISSKIRS